MNVKIAEVGRVLPPFRRGLHDDVILIQRSIERVDLALSEGIVQNVVNGGWRDSQPRRGHPIDVYSNGKPTVLLIGSHILQIW